MKLPTRDSSLQVDPHIIDILAVVFLFHTGQDMLIRDLMGFEWFLWHNRRSKLRLLTHMTSDILSLRRSIQGKVKKRSGSLKKVTDYDTRQISNFRLYGYRLGQMLSQNSYESEKKHPGCQ